MSKENKHALSKVEGLIPELRFPEFSENWEINLLSDICNVYRGGTFSKADMDENGSYPCIHYGELFTKYNEVITNIYSKTNKSEGLKSQVGDVLMPSSDVTPNGLAKASAIMLDNVVLGGDMNVLRPRKPINSIFISYLVNHSKKEIIKLVSGTTVKHIYPSQIITCQLPLVNNKKEQQKIASCLSSLDEVIDAHSQKLDVLKDHKKGLMQNLFPQEGEKVPKLRFKEFEKDGEWVEKKLGDCLLQKPTYGINASAVPFSNKLPKYLRITDISEDGYYRTGGEVSVDRDVTEDNYLVDSDIAVARTGASVGKSYKYRIKDGNLVFAGFLIRLRPNIKKIESELLFQFLSTTQYWKWVSFISARSGQPGINGTEYNSMPITLPPSLKEQQKIASCLSSLDALITAQAEKIEQLKLHKKGLMQGLFPKVKS
jgi:type I restriction enzyme, S subunit